MEVRVKETKICYHHNRRYRAGETFVIGDEKEFSFRNMEPVGWRPKRKAPKGYELPEEGQEEKTVEAKAKKPNNKKQPGSEDTVI